MADSTEKKRLDLLLAERGLAPSREKAKALIAAGLVSQNGVPCRKASALIPVDTPLEVRAGGLPYVSRGGLKLEKALKTWGFCLEHQVCMDIGASTGGFTDCMLQNGARKVYAVDVGSDQLALSLRQDDRVVNLEQTNIRHLTAEQVPDVLDFASVDVSFISLTLVLPVLARFLREGGRAVCLVKPQFEAGKGNVGKKGVVKDPKIHLQVLRSVARYAVENGFGVLQADYSPIKGPEGNIEYLYLLQKGGQSVPDDAVLRELTAAAHQALDR